jgi:hypothetical protein
MKRSKQARLEKAAPALLKACKAALAKLTGDGWDGTLGHHPDNPVPKMLREAIRKAEGGKDAPIHEHHKAQGRRP